MSDDQMSEHDRVGDNRAGGNPGDNRAGGNPGDNRAGGNPGAGPGVDGPPIPAGGSASPLPETGSTETVIPAGPVSPQWSTAAPGPTVPPSAPAGWGGFGGPGPGWAAPGTPPAGWPPPGWPPPASTHGSGRHRSRRKVIGATAVAAAVLAGVGIGHAVWQPSSSPSPESFSGGAASSGPSGTSGSNGSSSAGSGLDVSAIASTVDPGLVDINTTLGYQGAAAAGTGMVIDPSGVVLTNNHVIAGATSISATDIGNGRTYKATVVGYDTTHDVAVLQLVGASGLSTVSVGNSSTVSVGDPVVGIGNAGGTGGTPSAAAGGVTALGQSITASDQGSGVSEQLAGLIETDAGIQPGDSGGPLVNAAGKVIGMDTAGSSNTSFDASSTQAYAIPINQALSIAGSIRAGNASSTVHIGATALLGVQVSSSTQAGPGAGGSFGGQAGATVAGVVPGSPADDAGVTAGSVITSVGGETISSAKSLGAAMTTYHPGARVQVQWVDGSGQQQSATVQLTSGPPQ